MLNALSQFIFGNASSRTIFGRVRDGSKLPIWKDRSLCFDLKSQELELNQGEQLIACFFPIEDVKGNPDDQGLLKVTNLRLVWVCCKRRQINLSIGWHTVTMTFEQNLKDPLGQVSTSLCILSRYESTKYEFIFNKKGCQLDSWDDSDIWTSQLDTFVKDKNLQLTQLSPTYLIDPFTTVYKVWQCYKQTNLFRQCKSNLTHLLTRDTSIQYAGQQCGFRLSELNRLADEEILETYTSVEWIESKTTKYVGTLLLSNIRILWIDENIPLRNLSLPYIRVESIKLRQGGDRIIINTCDYVYNMTSIKLRLVSTKVPTMALKRNENIQDQQQTQTRALFDQIQNLYTLYKSRPKYGPESCDDCISLISHLKPVESLLRVVESAPVDMSGSAAMHYRKSTDHSVNLATSGGIGTDAKVQFKRTYDEQLESVEEELASNNIDYKLGNYLDERPLRYDRDLVYSKGKLSFNQIPIKCLGLELIDIPILHTYVPNRTGPGYRAAKHEC